MRKLFETHLEATDKKKNWRFIEHSPNYEFVFGVHLNRISFCQLEHWKLENRKIPVVRHEDSYGLHWRMKASFQ